MKKDLWIAAALAVLTLVTGCKSNGHAQNSTDMRVVNAVVDAEPLDVLVDDDVKVAALPFGSVSADSQFDSGTRDVKVRSSTAQTILTDKSISFSSGVNNTLVVFGKRSGVQAQVITDDTTTPQSGHFRVRVLNLSPDTGPIDLFLTTGDISSSGSVVPAATFGALTGSAEVTTGSLRITLTSAGTQDILFQSTAQTFNDNTTFNIIVLPSLGGKLVNVIVLPQGSTTAATVLQNPFARVKAVNGIPDSTQINFKADGAVLLSSVPFTGASSYVPTAAGTRNLQIEASNVPGTNIASLTQALSPARDYTMLAVGTLASPRIVAFADDNSLPTSGFAKIRFANALVGSTGADVLLNFASQTTNLGFAAASTYFQVTPGLTYTITYATPGGVTVIATLTPVELDAGAVYTAYLFGTGSNAQVKLVRDR